MRVFISHSSAESWIAKKIAEDLEKRGFEVFLDSKDLESEICSMMRSSNGSVRRTR